jgi:hypothetical protein
MPPAEVETLGPGGDPEISYLPPPPGASVLRIRVYDVCAEHGAHTDPEIEQRSRSYF